ncbi:MAG: hypothetical protein C0404_03710 [Verrucomicrobia bacterium]|nr:hypothetical protein [Verrucomicrobiota bacterium]
MDEKQDNARMKGDPAALDLRENGDARLLLRQADEKGIIQEIPVQAVCCFPWSQNRAFISLRDDKGHEVRMIEDMDQVMPETRKLIEGHLVRRLFIPRITSVESITEQMELFLWKVVTDAGPRSFLTASNESPRSLGGGRVLIKDVGNDLYLVESPDSMNERSRKLLWIYLD